GHAARSGVTTSGKQLTENLKYDQGKIQYHSRRKLGHPILVRCVQPSARGAGRISRPSFALPLKTNAEFLDKDPCESLEEREERRWAPTAALTSSSLIPGQ